MQAAHHRQGGTTAAKTAVALDDDLAGSPADETARSGIGDTGYAIDLSDRGRIPPASSSGTTPPREDGDAGAAHH